MASYLNKHNYQRLLSEDDAQPPDYFGRTGGKRNGSGHSEWTRIDDLDQFFTQVYVYYNRLGFLCISVEELFQLVQFAFIVFVTLLLGVATDYHFLFNYGVKETVEYVDENETRHSNVVLLYEGQSIFDAIDFGRFQRLSDDQVVGIVVCLLVAGLFWLARGIYGLRKVWEAFHIRRFYADYLKITDSDLPNKTWSDVVNALVRCQEDLSLCVKKEMLTELDIVHRILRRHNYLIAMQNKGVINHVYNFPLIGQRTFLTEGMKFNLKLILFSDPFATRWQLREEYKRSTNRVALAERMSSRFFWIGLLNLVLCPFVLLWQVLYSFFTYAESIRRQPGTLGTRRWSCYAKIRLRHFNELDHDLKKRLTCAYKPAKAYMDGFSSRILAILGECGAFFAGAWLAILAILTVINENLILSDNILGAYTVLILLFTVFRLLIPEENVAVDLKKSMEKVDRYVHYLPSLWKTESHTERVRGRFSWLFQYKVTGFAEELLSPVITPLLLMFCLRHKALDVIDFYQRFTVHVEGVGDVCSFAQMDVKKHGNPMFLSDELTEANDTEQAEDGKTEKSLLNFKGKYPKWRPSPTGEQFLLSVSQQGLPPVAAQLADHSPSDPCMTLGALPAVPEMISLSQLGPMSLDEHQRREIQAPEGAATNKGSEVRDNDDKKTDTMIMSDPADSLTMYSLYPTLVPRYQTTGSLYPTAALEAVRDECGQSISAVDHSINEQMLFVQRHAEGQEQRVRNCHQKFLGQSLNFRQDTNYTSDESTV